MDFLTTARLLMRLREDYPELRYEFVDSQLVMTIHVNHEVPGLFDQAATLFEPA